MGCHFLLQCIKVKSENLSVLLLNEFNLNIMWKKLLNTFASLISGEGNGTPLQYSCLENPMDGGAWKAAVHGVTEG